MAPRSDLQTLLVSIPGVTAVYFQPPATVSMTYPCIVYKVDDMPIEHADNIPYNRRVRYLVTVIDPDPDSAIPDIVLNRPLCRFDRAFQAGNLNHSVFNLYF